MNTVGCGQSSENSGKLKVSFAPEQIDPRISSVGREQQVRIVSTVNLEKLRENTFYGANIARIVRV